MSRYICCAERMWELVDSVVCEKRWLAVQAMACYMLSTEVCTGMCMVSCMFFFQRNYRLGW